MDLSSPKVHGKNKGSKSGRHNTHMSICMFSIIKVWNNILKNIVY